MKKEWIMSDEEKQVKNAKINENKFKKRFEGVWTSPNVVGCQQSPPVSEPDQAQSCNKVQLVQYVPTKPQARVNAMPQQQTAPVSIEALPPKLLQTTEYTQSNLSNFISSGEFSSDISWKNQNVGNALPSVSSLMNKNKYADQNIRQFSENFPHERPVETTVLSTEVQNTESPSNLGVENQSRCDAKNCDTLQKSWLKNTVNDVLHIAIASEYSDLATKSGLNSYGLNVLTTLEVQKINELLTANAVLNMHCKDDKLVFENAPNACLIDVINMTDNAIRKLIKMSKKLTAFKNLCQEDQIALLKGSCTELMILRSVMTYDSEKDCWQVPDTTYIKMDVLKQAKGNVYEEHKRFVQSFDPTWRSDETLMLILSAIVLFTPTRPNVVHPQVIKKEQYSYYFLLQRYLESKRSSCNAKDQFFTLIQMVQDLEKLNENHVRVFLDVNPKDVEPLLIEIFDLSS